MTGHQSPPCPCCLRQIHLGLLDVVSMVRPLSGWVDVFRPNRIFACRIGIVTGSNWGRIQGPGVLPIASRVDEYQVKVVDQVRGALIDALTTRHVIPGERDLQVGLRQAAEFVDVNPLRRKQRLEDQAHARGVGDELDSRRSVYKAVSGSEIWPAVIEYWLARVWIRRSPSGTRFVQQIACCLNQDALDSRG